MLKVVRYIYKFFWAAERSDKKTILFAIFIALIGMACNLSIPLYLKYLIEMGSEMNLQFGLLLAGGYGILWTASHLMQRLRMVLAIKAITRCTSLMIEDLFSIVLKVAPQYQKKSSETVGLIERLNTHLPNLIEGLIWHVIPTIIETIIMFGIVIRYTDVSIASILIGVIFVYLFTVVYSFERMQSYTEESATAHNNFIQTILDSLNNLEIVKLFNGYRIENEKVKNKIDDRENAQHRANKQMEGIGSLQLSIVGLGLTILTMLLISRIIHKQINVSDMILVNTYLMQFTVPLGYFGFVFISFQRGIGVIREILSMDKSILEFECDQFLPIEEKVEIQFKDLCVEQNGTKILSELNAVITPHAVTGIVGLSGNGKTSIIKSIAKLFPISSGHIYINNVDINTLSTTQLRSHVSVAPQETQLFQDTLLFNLTYGLPQVSKEALDRVLEVTNLTELIKRLPEGLETVITPEKRMLSKGEVQRITIARCLLKDAKVYIFDEPTSALDIKNEMEIMEKMLGFLKGRTVVIITHRYSTIKHADHLIVMGKGRAHKADVDIKILDELKLHELVSAQSL